MKVLEVIAISQKAAGTSVFCAEVSKRLNEVGGFKSVIAVPDVTETGMYGVSSNTRMVSIIDVIRRSIVCLSARIVDIVCAKIDSLYDRMITKISSASLLTADK